MVDDLTGFGSIATDAVIRLQEDFPKSKQLAMPIRLMPEPQARTSYSPAIRNYYSNIQQSQS